MLFPLISTPLTFHLGVHSGKDLQGMRIRLWPSLKSVGRRFLSRASVFNAHKAFRACVEFVTENLGWGAHSLLHLLSTCVLLFLTRSLLVAKSGSAQEKRMDKAVPGRQKVLHHLSLFTNFSSLLIRTTLDRFITKKIYFIYNNEHY